MGSSFVFLITSFMHNNHQETLNLSPKKWFTVVIINKGTFLELIVTDIKVSKEKLG